MPAEVETMFYYGDVPWHKQGTPLDQVATAEEAIAAAELGWEVETVPIYHYNKVGIVQIPNKVAVRRVTDQHVFSILHPEYVPIQNADAFSFFDSVVGTKAAKYHTAGSLNHGARIWILAKLPGSVKVKGDQVDKYLLLMNGHDGKLALKMFFTPVRVVCMNTLMAAEERATASRAAMFYSRHTGGIQTRMEFAREILGITNEFYDKFAEQANFLASKQLPAAQVPKLLVAAFGTATSQRPSDIVKLDDFTKRREREMARVADFIENGKGIKDNPAIKGTRWAAYNGIVEYLDYGKKYGGADPDNLRLNNTWFGRGGSIKSKALTYLLKAK